MSAGFSLSFPLELVGDGTVSVFSVKLTKTTFVSNSANAVVTGGVDLGIPVAVGSSPFPNSSVALNGFDVTFTFSIPPTGALFGSLQVIYG